MLRAIDTAPAGRWPRDEAADHVTLDYQDRTRRRFRYTADGGLVFLLDLPEVRHLRDGDGLSMADGRWIGVRSAPEDLVEVRAESAHALARLAWHLGNRHLPAAIMADCILIRRDHVIEEMLTARGATLIPVMRPFDPEGGAYEGRHELAATHHHGHSHTPDGDHGIDQSG